MPDKLLRVIAYAFPHVLVFQIVIAVFVTWYIYRSCYRYVIYKVSTTFFLHLFTGLEHHMPRVYYENLEWCMRRAQGQFLKVSILAIPVPA